MSATRLPSGLDAALKEFAEVVGSDAVLTASEDVHEYRDPYWPTAWPDTAPPAVVRPATVEEVQSIVRIAIRHDVRIWVNSRGRNNCYGGASARTRDAVVVNLGRMNRVLEVNDELAYVVVEPGVSYNDLYEHLRAIGSTLWMDCPDIGWGSPVGNMMDHGVGFTVYGDHAGSVCGMEVVLPDGDLLRTGMGAMEGGKSWHVSKRGFGPTPDGMFMQSNFGIVTKVGFWAMPRPEIYKPCVVKVAREDQLAALVDAIRPLILDRTLENIPTVYNVLAAAANVLPRSALHDGPGLVPQEAIDAFAAKADLGAWNARLALYGTEAVVDDSYRRLEEAMAAVPDARVEGTAYRGDDLPVETFDQSTKVQAGIPDMSMVRVADWRGGGPGGHVGFASTTPLTGRDAQAIYELVRDGNHRAGVDLTVGGLLCQRSFIFVSLMVFELEDPARAERAWEMCNTMIKAAAKMGYGEYRAHTTMMDMVADQYDFNDHAQRRFNERIKDALDPDGILMPGRQGIWPRRDRLAREQNGA